MRTLYADVESVNNKVEEIANLLAHPDNKFQNLGYGFYAGKAGIAFTLFLCARHLEKNIEEYNEAAIRILQSCLEDLFSQESHLPTFANGMSGLAWSLDYLSKNDFLDFDQQDEVLDHLDHYIRVSINAYQRDLDYLHGLQGIIYYYISLKKPSEYFDVVKQYLENLYKKRVISDAGKAISWEYYNPLLQRSRQNLSLSHGIASTIFLLTKIAELKNDDWQDLCLELLNGAANYVLSQQFAPNKYYSHFPTLSLDGCDKEDVDYSSRLAWCYGDLGIANSLLRASNLLDNTMLKETSLAILKSSTQRRSFAETTLYDNGFCHGRAGVANIYDHLYLITDDHQLKEARDYWVLQTLKTANFDDGLAGFKTYNGEKQIYENDYGLLNGVSGIGLSLLCSATSRNDLLDWREAMML